MLACRRRVLFAQRQCVSKAAYAAAAPTELAGVPFAFPGETSFKEVAVRPPKPATEVIDADMVLSRKMNP